MFPGSGHFGRVARAARLARAARALAVALFLAGLGAAGCHGGPRRDSLFQAVGGEDLPGSGPTYGGTVLDWDGDHLPDLLVSLHTDRAEVYLNRGGLRFARLPDDGSRPALQPDNHGSAACDFDRDGDWDVLVAVGSDSGYALGRNQLWVQTAPGRFADAGAGQETLADPVGRGRGGLWADFDADGFPELLIFNYQSQARLAAFDGAAWRDVTGRLPWPPPVPMAKPGGGAPGPRERARSAWIHTACAADLDGDGRTDLLALGRPGWSGLLLNRGDGAFFDATAACGLEPALWPATPSHACAADLDEDGDLDLVLGGLGASPASGSGPIWLNESHPGRPAFRLGGDVAPEPGRGPGVINPLVSLAADLDNDGVLDLYCVEGTRGTPGAPNRIFQGRGKAAFVEKSAAWGGCGPVGGSPESAVAVDLDHDGDLDLVTFNGRDETPDPGLQKGIVLYRNREAANLGLTIALESRQGPPHGLGARVQLRTEAGLVTRRQFGTNTGSSSSILPLHFGVGTAPGPFTAVVEWATGHRDTVALPQAGRAYVIGEGAGQARLLPVRTEGGS